MPSGFLRSVANFHYELYDETDDNTTTEALYCCKTSGKPLYKSALNEQKPSTENSS